MADIDYYGENDYADDPEFKEMVRQEMLKIEQQLQEELRNSESESAQISIGKARHSAVDEGFSIGGNEPTYEQKKAKQQEYYKQLNPQDPSSSRSRAQAPRHELPDSGDLFSGMGRNNPRSKPPPLAVEANDLFSNLGQNVRSPRSRHPPPVESNDLFSGMGQQQQKSKARASTQQSSGEPDLFSGMGKYEYRNPRYASNDMHSEISPRSDTRKSSKPNRDISDDGNYDYQASSLSRIGAAGADTSPKKKFQQQQIPPEYPSNDPFGQPQSRQDKKAAQYEYAQQLREAATSAPIASSRVDQYHHRRATDSFSGLSIGAPESKIDSSRRQVGASKAILNTSPYGGANIGTGVSGGQVEYQNKRDTQDTYRRQLEADRRKNVDIVSNHSRSNSYRDDGQNNVGLMIGAMDRQEDVRAGRRHGHGGRGTSQGGGASNFTLG